MATQIDSLLNKRNEMIKKRNLLLFFVSFPLFLFIVIFVVLSYMTNLGNDLIITIYLPISIIYLIFTLWVKGKFSYFEMNIQYLSMLLDEIGPVKLGRKIFTTSWVEKIKENGFKLLSDEKDYMYFYLYTDKLNKISNRKDACISIVLAKNSSFDFYSEHLENEKIKLLSLEPKGFKTKIQITLQFIMYDQMDEETTNKISRIINFKSNQQYLIHITVGYFSDQNMIYFLCPQKAYPSKYYYYACWYIKQLCEVEDKVIK